MRNIEKIKDDIILNYQEQIEILKSINDINDRIIKSYERQSQIYERYVISLNQKKMNKQETLEEVVDRLSIKEAKDLDLFLNGMKYQQERSYSEEEVINALHSVELKDNKDYSKIYNGMKEWFKQFKKK